MQNQHLEEDAVAQVSQSILAAIAQAAGNLEFPANENALQQGVAACLAPSERELKASFAASAIPPRCPPQHAIDELAARTPPRVLPPTGRDPCVGGARLDVLWHSSFGPIAIELKYCEQWKSDVNGYQFLKDVHRLERMVSAGRHTLAELRYAAFLTNQPVYWLGQRPEPRPFWLTEGRVLSPGLWVQYDQQSTDTLWYSYPPFFLSGSYTLRWVDVRPSWKCLLVLVRR